MSVAGRVGQLLLAGAIVALAAPKFTHFFYGPVPIQLSDALVGLAALCTLAHAATTRTIRWSWMFVGFAVYLTGACLSLINVDSLWRGVVKIVGIMSLMAAPTVTLQIVDSASTWRRLHTTWVCAAAFVGALTCLGVLAFFLGAKDQASNPMLGNYGSLPPGRIPRMEGPFLNSNQYSNYLAVSLCLWGARLPDLSARFGRARAWLIGAPIALALPFTLSPNLGAAALSLAIFIQVVRLRPPALRWALISGCAVTMIGFFVAAALIILPKGSEGISLGPLGVLSTIPSGRVAAALAMLKTIGQHPLLGTGVGETVAHFHHEYSAQGASVHIKDFEVEAHNFYLGLWGQMGPLALIGFLTVVSAVLSSLPRKATVAETTYLRAGFLAAICGQLLYGGLFGGFEDSRHIWMMLALAVASSAAIPASQAGTGSRGSA